MNFNFKNENEKNNHIIKAFTLYDQQTKIYLKFLNLILEQFDYKLLIIIENTYFDEKKDTYEISIIHKNIGHYKTAFKIKRLVIKDSDLTNDLNTYKREIKYKSLEYILKVLIEMGDNIGELKEEEFVFISPNKLLKNLINFEDIKQVIKQKIEREYKSMFNKNDLKDLREMYKDLKESIITTIKYLNDDLEQFEKSKKTINAEIEKLKESRRLQDLLKIEPPFDQFNGFKNLNLIFANEIQTLKKVLQHHTELEETTKELIKEKEGELQIINDLIKFTKKYFED